MFNNVLEWEKFTKKNFLTKFLHNNKYTVMFKILNKYTSNKIKILDLGCGFADSFIFLNKNFNIDYLGIEENIEVFKITEDRYKNYNNFKIENKDLTNIKNFDGIDFDIVIMFDVLEHIKLPNRLRLIEKIHELNFKKLLINVPNEVGIAIFIKNIGSKLMRYKRDLEYSNYDTFNAVFRRIEKIPPHLDRHKGFDWYVLKYILHYYFEIIDTHTLLNSMLPKSISPSIFFECHKR